jgi:hypothetical protein
MSQLALLTDCEVHEEPRIYSFRDFCSRPATIPISTGDRARLQHRNRACPICNRVTVESIELKDGQLGRNGRMIPGTGTLVGFGCNACGHEWPA